MSEPPDQDAAAARHPETWGTRSWRLNYDNLLELERFSTPVNHPWPAVARLVMLAVAELRERRATEREVLTMEDLRRERDQAISELASSRALARLLAGRDADRVERVEDHAQVAYYRESWSEDNGVVLWWKFPVSEPPYAGTPLDDDFPEYATHWTRIHVPGQPIAEGPSPVGTRAKVAQLCAKVERLTTERDTARTERDDWYRRAIRAEQGGPEALKDAVLQEARAIVERDEARAELKRADKAWVARLDEATVEVERVTKERDQALRITASSMAKERDQAIKDRDRVQLNQLWGERFSRMEKERDVVTKERDKANAELSALRVVVEYGSATPAALASDLARLRSDRKIERDELERLKALNLLARAKVTQLRAELDVREEQKKIDKLTKERDEAIADGVLSTKVCGELMTSLERLRSDFSAALTERASLTAERDDARERSTELRKEVTLLEQLTEREARPFAQRDMERRWWKSVRDSAPGMIQPEIDRLIAPIELRSEAEQVAELERLDALDELSELRVEPNADPARLDELNETLAVDLDGLDELAELRVEPVIVSLEASAKDHTRWLDDPDDDAAESAILDERDAALAVDSANALPGSSLVNLDVTVPITDGGMSDLEMGTLDELATRLCSEVVDAKREIGVNAAVDLAGGGWWDKFLDPVQITAVSLARLVGNLMLRHEMRKLEGGK